MCFAGAHLDKILIFVLAGLSNDGAILHAPSECGFVFGKQDLQNHFRYKINKSLVKQR